MTQFPSPFSSPPEPPPFAPVRRSRRLPLLIGVFLGLLGGTVLVQQAQRFIYGRTGGTPRPIAPRGDLADDEKATIRLFEQTSSSVVNITSISTRRSLFGMDVTEIPSGTGSGFIWDESGHIVTNFHVLLDANKVEVTLANRSTHRATFVGAAPEKDLAVLRIDAPPDALTPILVGSSDDLQVGQKVFAIGNPFGLDHTLTTGIISALGRTIKAFGERTIDGVVQTDAAINPGNSGGPLLDSAGRLIGVNTQIASPSGASAGIGFAIPVDVVNEVVPQLIAHGRVIRPYLGIERGPDLWLQRLNLKGVLIARVIPGSGAEAAGLRGTSADASGDIVLGDIITAVDGMPVNNYDELVRAMEKKKIGDTVSVTYRRGDTEQSTTVVLQGPPAER